MSVEIKKFDESLLVQSDSDIKSADLAGEDVMRAHVYRLLAGFLARPPTEDDLKRVRLVEGNKTDFGKAFEVFAHLCNQSGAEAVKAEYHDLFIGVGRGELLPYASYYLTGFLNEKPLAKLRNDMMELGVEKVSSNSDPEDHIAAILEIMAGLIVGDFATPAELEDQKEFFQEHINSWAGHFFNDLASAKSSVVYASLADLGRQFLEIEETAFQMVD